MKNAPTFEDVVEAADDPLNRHSLASWKRDRDAELDAVRAALTAGFDAVRATAESLPVHDEDDDATTFHESGGFILEGVVRPALEFIIEHARLEPDARGNTNPLHARARRVRVAHGARFDDEVAALRAYYAALDRGARHTGATARAVERYRMGIVDLGGAGGVREPIADPHVEAVAEAVQALRSEAGADAVEMLRLTYVELESARDRYDGGGMRAGAWPAVAAARAVREWFGKDARERREEPCPMPAWARVPASSELTASMLVADRLGLVVVDRRCSECEGSGRVWAATLPRGNVDDAAWCARCRGDGRVRRLAEGRELQAVEDGVRRTVKAARARLRDLLRGYRLDVRPQLVVPAEEPKAPYELPTRADQEARADRGPRADVDCCVGFLMQGGVRVACRAVTVRGPKLMHPSASWPRCDACGCPVVPQRRAASPAHAPDDAEEGR